MLSGSVNESKRTTLKEAMGSFSGLTFFFIAYPHRYDINPSVMSHLNCRVQLSYYQVDTVLI